MVADCCRHYFEYFCCSYSRQFHRNWLILVISVFRDLFFDTKLTNKKAKWETSASVTNEQGVSKTIFKNSMLEMYKGRVLLNFL